MRKSLTAAVLAAAVLPVLLTGCNAEVTASDGTKARITDQDTPGTASPSSDAGAGSGSGTSSKQARPAGDSQPGSGAAATRACSRIKARVTFEPKQANTAVVAITNTSGRSCSVKGWPGLRFTNAANEVLDLRAHKLEVPGVPQRFRVAPGATVYAGMKWKPCDKAAASCNVISGMRVFAPGSTHQVAVGLPADVATHQSFTIAAGSLNAGILTPTRGEALMWEDDGE